MVKQPRQRKQRGQGRPSVERAVGEAAIVGAVRTALRSTPPGELTFNHIATLAGVDQRLIRYYFGSLPDLLRATAIEITQEIRTRILAANARPGSVRDRISLRVSIFLDTFGENPHYHRLVVDYLFNAPGQEREEALEGLRNSVGELGVFLGEAGADQLKEADARLVHVTMAALCEFFFSARPVFVALFGKEADSDAFRSKYQDFVTDLLVVSTPKGAGAARSRR